MWQPAPMMCLSRWTQILVKSSNQTRVQGILLQPVLIASQELQLIWNQSQSLHLEPQLRQASSLRLALALPTARNPFGPLPGARISVHTTSVRWTACLQLWRSSHLCGRCPSSL